MIKNQIQKFQAMQNAYLFCIFNISKLKMHGLKSNLIYKPTVCKGRQLKQDIKKQRTQPNVEGQQK
jgi:hypothetical protein